MDDVKKEIDETNETNKTKVRKTDEIKEIKDTKSDDIEQQLIDFLTINNFYYVKIEDKKLLGPWNDKIKALSCLVNSE